MKNAAIVIPFLLMAGFLPSTAGALPYSLEVGQPDISLRGTDFHDISRLGATPRSGGGEWYAGEDGSIWTAWQGQWVSYEAYLTEGEWNIGLDVKNHGNLGTGWYSTFQILNALTEETLEIAASDQDWNNGYVTVDIDNAGDYVVRYTWMNDRYAPPLDANIEIGTAFFDNTGTAPVPEPATVLLFGSGLLGAATVLGRKRRT